MMRVFRVCLAIFAVLLFGACSSLKKQPVFVVSLHEVVQSADMVTAQMIIQVPSADGKHMQHVRRMPMLNSANIYKAEILPEPKGKRYGLRLYFDDYSLGLVQEATIYRNSRSLAVVVDGFLAGYTKLSGNPEQLQSLETDALWTLPMAKKIVENVQRNYQLMNGKD